ncbi:hypothetical protein EII25_03325 [Erysipelotrichaceae bacterium OH741_COT-311]|nr:hypothetical protein EII25_03325 [Erysipelotrichaceae bacterium OH741_COT-311]
MELIILDKDFQELLRVDLFHSFIWIEKYHDSGEYELHLSKYQMNDFSKAKYLYRNDVMKLTLIESLDFELKPDGSKTFKIGGNFIEKQLDNRVFEKEKTYSGTHSEIANQIVSEYFPGIKIKASNLGVQTTTKFDGQRIGTALYKFLKEQELSQRIIYDYLDNTLTYEVYKGIDRTDTQSVNDWAIFGDDNETIENIKYGKSIAKYYNYAIVTGDGDKTNPTTEIVDWTNGNERREIRIKGPSSRKKNDSNVDMSESEYRAMLIQKGKEALEKASKVEFFDGNLINRTYRHDYNLGDLCNTSLCNVGVYAYKRIIEVKEIFENKDVKVVPKFGNDYETLSDILGGVNNES